MFLRHEGEKAKPSCKAKLDYIFLKIVNLFSERNWLSHQVYREEMSKRKILDLKFKQDCLKCDRFQLLGKWQYIPQENAPHKYIAHHFCCLWYISEFRIQLLRIPIHTVRKHDSSVFVTYRQSKITRPLISFCLEKIMLYSVSMYTSTPERLAHSLSECRTSALLLFVSQYLSLCTQQIMSTNVLHR